MLVKSCWTRRHRFVVLPDLVYPTFESFICVFLTAKWRICYILAPCDINLV
jgi:hypothetical protein